jgi:hypothetical protein
VVGDDETRAGIEVDVVASLRFHLIGKDVLASAPNCVEACVGGC